MDNADSYSFIHGGNVMTQWIKCSERLPDDKREYLIHSETYGFRTAYYDKRRKCWDDGDFFDKITGVTHWSEITLPEVMPL